MDIRLGTLFLFSIVLVDCKSYEDPVWDNILDHENSMMKMVLQDPDKYELQIIYTEVNKTSTGTNLIRHTYALDTNTYFYPASSVKMPVAFLALEKLKSIKKSHPDIGIFTPMAFDSIRPAQSSMYYDSCSGNGLPTIASLIDQVFTISDNNAYNRLFEFTGQEYINKQLYAKNIFTNSRILTRVGVSGYDSLENTYCNPIRFLDNESKDVLKLSANKSSFTHYPEIPNSVNGKGFYDDDKDETMMVPFDMSQKNFINLADLDRIIKRIVLPDHYPFSERFDIDDSDYDFLMSSMGKLPGNIDCYADNIDHYYDGYVKFFMYGDQTGKIPDHIIIKNKVGLAYGYLTDVAHISDTLNNIEFFLSATLLVNENQIYNDGIYEYDSIGIPFLAELGRQVYAHELEKAKLPK